VVIWYILWSFGIFCGHLVYFVVIWYILWSFGIFCGHFLILVCYFYYSKVIYKEIVLSCDVLHIVEVAYVDAQLLHFLYSYI
jgi:hypothetical protein